MFNTTNVSQGDSNVKAGVGDYAEGMPEQVLRTLDLPATQFVGGIPFLPVGGTVIIYGAPGVGKSFIQQGINHTVAWGKPIHGFVPETLCDVLYCDFEANDSLAKDRSLLLTPFGQLASDNGGRKIATDIHWVWPEDWKGRTYAEHLAELEERLEARENRGAGFGLVVLDTYTGFMCGNPDNKNAYDLDQQQISPLNELAAKYQVCIVLIHHPNVSGKLSGSIGRSGTVFQVLKFHKVAEGEAVLEMEKNRVGPELSFSYQWDRDRIWRLATDIPPQQALAKGNHRKILGLLHDCGPVTKSQLMDKTGLSSGSLDSALNRMAKKGLVERNEDGWATTFPKATEQMPKAPEYRRWIKCPTCNCVEDQDLGCPNTGCERYDATRWITSPPQQPKLRLVTEEPRAHRATRKATPRLDYSGMASQEEIEAAEGDKKRQAALKRRGALKAGMDLMVESREGAKVFSARFAEQPKLEDGSPIPVWEGKIEQEFEVPLAGGAQIAKGDVNCAYLSACNTHLPLDGLEHDEVPVQAGEKRPNTHREDRLQRRAGYHLIDPGDVTYPCGGPFANRKETGPVWVATPTLDALARYHRNHGLSPVVALDSWTYWSSEMPLREWADILKAERTAALEAGDRRRYEFVKYAYSLPIETMSTTGNNHDIARDEWKHIIRARAFAGQWEKAVAAHEAGVTIVHIGGTDELHFVVDEAARKHFSVGPKPGQIKIKGLR